MKPLCFCSLPIVSYLEACSLHHITVQLINAVCQIHVTILLKDKFYDSAVYLGTHWGISHLINVVPYDTYSKPMWTAQLCSCSGLCVRSCLLSSPSLRDGRIRQITPINDDMFTLPTRFHLPPAAIPSTRQRNKYSCKLKAAEWVQVHPFNFIQTIQTICSQLIPSLHRLSDI